MARAGVIADQPASSPKSCRHRESEGDTRRRRHLRSPTSDVGKCWRSLSQAAEPDPATRIVAIGPFWTGAADPSEIDAVALAGRGREAVLLGEAKWAKRVEAPALRAELERKAVALPRLTSEPRYAICARERVDRAGDTLAITAAEVF